MKMPKWLKFLSTKPAKVAEPEPKPSIADEKKELREELTISGQQVTLSYDQTSNEMLIDLQNDSDGNKLLDVIADRIREKTPYKKTHLRYETNEGMRRMKVEVLISINPPGNEWPKFHHMQEILQGVNQDYPDRETFEDFYKFRRLQKQSVEEQAALKRCESLTQPYFDAAMSTLKAHGIYLEQDQQKQLRANISAKFWPLDKILQKNLILKTDLPIKTQVALHYYATIALYLQSQDIAPPKGLNPAMVEALEKAYQAHERTDGYQL